MSLKKKYIHIFRAVERNNIDIILKFRNEYVNMNFTIVKEGTTLLHIAAKNNSLDVLKYLIEVCNLDLNRCDALGNYPQHHAAEYNSLEVIKYFRGKNINLNVKNSDGVTLLHKASFSSALDVLKYLIEVCNLDLNNCDALGNYPQHYAAAGNSLGVIEYFKGQNIDLNVKNSDGLTLLHKASFNKALDVLHYLLEECNMDINVSDKYKTFPHHRAALGNACNVYIYLRNKNANLNSRDIDGNTSLHMASFNNSLTVFKYIMENLNMDLTPNNDGSYPQHLAAENNAVDIIKYLRSCDVNLNVQNSEGNTLLHIASQNNSLDVVKYLLDDCNMQINVNNIRGYFPQHSAARGNAVDVLKYFKKRKINFSVRDNDEDTLIHKAAFFNSLNALQYLTQQCNMSLNVCNLFGSLPQHHAAKGNALDVIKYLRKLRIKFNVVDIYRNTLIHRAASTDSVDVIKYLIDYCNMYCNMNEFGNYPQHHAARENSLNVIKYFKSRGVDLNVKDFKGHTLLHTAALHNSLEVFKYLITKCGMRLNVTNKFGEFPQHHAAEGNALDIIKYMKGQKMNLEVKDFFGNTLIHKATSGNSIEVIKYLIEECNMNPNSLNVFGLLPQDYATKSNALDIIKYFKDYKFKLNIENVYRNTLIPKKARGNSEEVINYLIQINYPYLICGPSFQEVKRKVKYH